MSRRRLRTVVLLRDMAGTLHTFGPDSDLPPWAVDRIRNPAAWADPTQPLTPSSSQPAPGSPALVQPPPRHGKGSGREQWAGYAAERGVAVDPKDSRDDILDRLVDAGLPIE